MADSRKTIHMKGYRTTYGRALHPKVAGTREVFDLLLAAIRQIGDVSVARRMIGLSNEDMSYWTRTAPAEIDAAVIIGDKLRVKTAMALLEKAGKTAMLLDDVPAMIAVAKIIAPELTVYPVEAERARARQDYSSPAVAVQISENMSGLGVRLQEALKVQSGVREIEDE